MKTSVSNFLFLCTLLFQTHITFANDEFAPIASETWECSPNKKIGNNLNIIVDNINLRSTGIYNGVLLNNDGSDLHSLSGTYIGQDLKFYSIVLVPNKQINYFRGQDELVITGKAIVHFEESNDCIGESRGQLIYSCKVSIER